MNTTEPSLPGRLAPLSRHRPNLAQFRREMREVTDQIRGFLQYIALQFIDHPEKAQLRVAEVDADHLSFRLILDHSDVAMLIGHGGFTAGAIRSVLSAAAERNGVKVHLRIHSVEEEQQRQTELEARAMIDGDDR